MLFFPLRGCSRQVRGRMQRRQGRSKDVCAAGHGDRQTVVGGIAYWHTDVWQAVRGRGGGVRTEHVGGCLCTPAPARRWASPAGWGKLGSSPDSAGGDKWVKPGRGQVPKVRPGAWTGQGHLGVSVHLPRRPCLRGLSSIPWVPRKGLGGRRPRAPPLGPPGGWGALTWAQLCGGPKAHPSCLGVCSGARHRGRPQA